MKFINYKSILWAKYGFQDPATPLMEGIIDVHNHVMYFIVVIFIFVSWWIYKIVNTFSNVSNSIWKKELYQLKLTHNTLIEIIWTIIPSIILFLIAMPSFLLLYSMDEIINPLITLKIIGNQWYWAYEYSDYDLSEENISFDSYMIPEDELEIGQLRLLEVDNPVVLPVNTHIRTIITALDVLHSWAVPSLGIKVDAVPGRLNQGSIYLKRLGTFYGQCSEICGVNHGFMPITIKSVTLTKYIEWLFNIK